MSRAVGRGHTSPQAPPQWAPMPKSQPFPSLDAVGPTLGPLSAAHIDSAFRRILRGPSATFAPSFTRLVTGEPHPFGNFVVVRRGDDPDAIAAGIEPLCRCGAPSAVLLTVPPTEALLSLLARDGFVRHGGLPAMAVAIDALAPTRLPDAYTFERLNGRTARDAWSEAFARGYELPRRIGDEFGAPLGDDTGGDDLQYFAVLRDGAIVSTSLLHLSAGVAGIYCVATVPQERRRGLGAHATAEPLRLAQAQGYRVGVLQSSEAGHPVYRALGFADVGDVLLFVRMPAA